jgi:hypothetical protein
VDWDVPANAIDLSDEVSAMLGTPPGTPVTFEAFLDLIGVQDRPRVHRDLRSSVAMGEPFIDDFGVYGHVERPIGCPGPALST